METRARLTLEQTEQAQLPDWRLVGNRLAARFVTDGLRPGIALADQAERAAPGAAENDMVVTLASGATVIGLGVGRGATSADLETARAISAVAAGLGLRSDPAGLTVMDLGLDTADGNRLAPFYAALLGGDLRDGEPVDPSGQVPTLWWQETDPADAQEPNPLPQQDFDQRWHHDVWVAPDEGQRRVAAAVAAGGRLVSDAHAPAFWVLEDADGNRSCVCTAASR